MNEFRSRKEAVRSAAKGAARALAIAAAVVLFGGLPHQQVRVAQANNPIMHNSSSVGSSYWGGGWGNTSNSKYGKFTCTTCHTTGPTGVNMKQIRSNIVSPKVGDPFPGSTVVFRSYTSYGSDFLSRSSSQRICEVCHSQTAHHRYDNTTKTPTAATTHNGDVDCFVCHKHSNGFKKATQEGGGACHGCHADLYGGSNEQYGMHSGIARISYKHYLDNDDLAFTTGPAGIPDGDKNLSSRRCTMCHVDHATFKVASSATTGRAFNLRDRADGSNVTRGVNDDYGLCLSCHYQEKNKFLMTPNGSTKVMPIPMAGLTYDNATSVLTFSTHGYAVPSTFVDKKLGNSTFRGICTKCHNDTIGANGDLGNKSSVAGQDSTYKFGEHNSTIPSRFAVFSNIFYQRPVTGTQLSYDAGTKTITITPSPGWVTDEFLGHTVVVTGGTGNNQRRRVITNSANTLTIDTAFSPALDTNAMIDVSDDNMSVDNVCFSCHSRAGQEKPVGFDQKDWYNRQTMKSSLEGIMDLFVGDSGTLTSNIRTTSITVTTTKSWAAGQLVGFKFKAPNGTRTISAQTAASTGTAPGPYTTTFTISPKLNSGTGTGPWEIMKPAFHPLDTYSRHDSYERVNPYIGWNKGDGGTSTGATSDGLSISDNTKSWSGSEFANMTIWFPGDFDQNGAPAKSTIRGGGTGVITFDAIPGFAPDTAGGDNYFIGNADGTGRHVACADCHNTHATFNNPEGQVTSAGTDWMIASDSVNRGGWRDGIWVGFLIKVVSSGYAEQIRYIKSFDKATGKYTVSLPWSTQPDNTYTYEVLMGDKWVDFAQSGGRAGSGSSGTWGVVVNGWRPSPAYGNMTGAVALGKIENVFDNVSTSGLKGSPRAGQRDLCVKCHSSYAYGTTTPNTPSGGPGANSYARSTDVLKEFNPNNPAHHAVYARGKNQPITATGDVVGAASYYNAYWPAYGATLTGAPYTKATLGATNDTNKTVTIQSDGTATFAGGNIPKTTRPGWFLYVNAAAGGAALAQGATRGWFEVVSVDSNTQVTVRPTPTKGPYTASVFKLTAGLGNNFVPPSGPWSILRCTDCHGSLKKDPVGPHASVNKWLIKSLDTDMSFEFYDGGTDAQGQPNIVTVKPNTGAVTAIFCFNCHRRDVYGDANCYNDTTALATNKIAYRSFARLPHSGASGTSHPDRLTLTGMFNDDNRTVSASTLVWKDISCRHCHVGDQVGGIHGTNAKGTNSAAANYNKSQGKRFLNGASWNGYKIPTGTTPPTCYAISSNAVSTCGARSNSVATSPPLYNYTGSGK